LPHVSYSKLRDNLASYMDEVCNGRAPLVITRRNARSVVLMSEEDYDGLMETVQLLNSPANAERLLRSIADADQDRLTERTMVAVARDRTVPVLLLRRGVGRDRRECGAP
jgi:antitoxin YefM